MDNRAPDDPIVIDALVSALSSPQTSGAGSVTVVERLPSFFSFPIKKPEFDKAAVKARRKAERIRKRDQRRKQRR